MLLWFPRVAAQRGPPGFLTGKWVAPFAYVGKYGRSSAHPVVDDEHLVRLAMVEALKDGGYSVVEAANGQAALEQIDQADQLRGLVTTSGWDPVSMAESLPAVLAGGLLLWPSSMSPETAPQTGPQAGCQ